MNEHDVEQVVRRVVAALEARGAGLGAEGAGAEGASSTQPAPWPPRTIAVGADHGGYEMKEDLKRFLEMKKLRVVDCGTSSKESVDYPDFARAVARAVAEGRSDAGIVIDGAGIGSGMAANKVRGVRCAVCHDIATVLNAREHNDANVLSMGAGVVSAHLARRMAALFVQTAHGGGRHWNRVRKIMEIEG
jgi:ribose 5-phosphate isomerase B